jgi:hypothetical protein
MGEPVAINVDWSRTGGVGVGRGEPVAKSTEFESALPFEVTLTESITGSTISSDRASRTKALVTFLFTGKFLLRKDWEERTRTERQGEKRSAFGTCLRVG